MNISFGPNMFRPGVHRKQFGIGSLVFTIIFGAIFLAVGLGIRKAASIDPGWTIISGTVTGLATSTDSDNTTHAPIVEYTVNGRAYSTTSSISSSSRPAIGSSRQVAYDPANPADAKLVQGSGLKLLTLLPVIIGLGCIALTPYLFIRSRRHGRAIQDLTQSGQKITGVLSDIQTAGSSNTSSTGYKIVVSATGPDGSVQNYVSDPLEGIGALAMTDFARTPIPIDVYLDPANSRNYYVDVSDIPKLTPERISQMVQAATHGQPLPGAFTPQSSQPAVSNGEQPPFQRYN